MPDSRWEMGGDTRSDADPALHLGREEEKFMRKLTLFAAAALAVVSAPALATGADQPAYAARILQLR